MALKIVDIKSGTRQDYVALEDGNVLTVRHYDGWICNAAEPKKLYDYHSSGAVLMEKKNNLDRFYFV